MQCPGGEEATLGHFALVSYISGPLATYLDTLSRDLSPDCNPRAHVTVLPPRPHDGELKDTIAALKQRVRQFQPFRVEIGAIEIFPASHVIYLSLSQGAGRLREIHRSLNSDCLEYREAFPYHPHVTIAQDLTQQESVTATALAKQRWAKYQAVRGFDVTELCFVQHVAPSVWVDVATLPLPRG